MLRGPTDPSKRPPNHSNQTLMNRWLKRVGYVLGTVVVLVLLVVGVVYALSERRFRRSYPVPSEQVTLATDSTMLARGEHIANAIAGCVDCHGEGLRGKVMFDAAPMGRLVAVNLTKGAGGVGDRLTPELVERAVRHGLGHDGRPLRVMPANDFQYMSDEDVRAIVAYVLTRPPIDNELSPTKLMLLPRALLVAGVFPMLPAEEIADSAGSPMSVTPGPMPEYGAYLSMIGGCKSCHGPGLSGGKIPAGDPSWGPAANLTREGNLGKWTEAEFVQTLRTGKRPDGVMMKDPMPWKMIGRMTDDELRAIWLYLQSVPAKPFGGR
jgi:mono/diheme cytochrome c family protein